uniref:Uncharacterized protein n=1 Tax=Meloidogyne enterolobii TaxID=390850 RepID=A0A6V7TYT0_MELEN|nr:unnamed protein product [Meloidogyne enterolobii]
MLLKDGYGQNGYSPSRTNGRGRMGAETNGRKTNRRETFGRPKLFFPSKLFCSGSGQLSPANSVPPIQSLDFFMEKEQRAPRLGAHSWARTIGRGTFGRGTIGRPL